jgi:hypothetical protein
MLFNLVADMLAVLTARAKEDGQVGGLISHLVEGGILILQYADDTILFLEHDLQKAVNMKSSKSSKLPRIESLRMTSMSLSWVPFARELEFYLWY